MSSSMSFSPYASGLGMIPTNSSYDKNPSAAQQASSSMNANWYAMAQMAAQDYFSRLQMSGMVHPDMANFPALGAMNSVHTTTPPAATGNKNNTKRKDKLSTQDDYYKSSSSREVSC